jgi:hypothetical protein
MIDVLIQGAATPLAIFGLLAAAFAVTYVRDWYRPTGQVPPRRDGRIPADERRLLGDDWRDCVRRSAR